MSHVVEGREQGLAGEVLTVWLMDGRENKLK